MSFSFKKLLTTTVLALSANFFTLQASTYIVRLGKDTIIKLPEGICIQLNEDSLIQLPEGSMIQLPEGACLQVEKGSVVQSNRTCLAKPKFYFNWHELGGFITAEAGYQVFHHLPTFSFGSLLNTVTLVAYPPDIFTAENDQPQSAYVRFGAGSLIPSSCFSSCWLGEESFIKAEGFFAADSLHNTIITSASPLLAFFPLINGHDGSSYGVNNGFGGLKRDYYYQGLELSMGSTYFLEIKECTCFRATPYTALGINQFKQNYGLEMFAGSLPILELSENLRTNYYDLGGGLKIELPIGCFSAFIDAGGFLSFARTSFHAKQFLLGVSVLDLGFDGLKDYQNTVNGKFKGSIGLNVYCYRGMEVGIIGRYEYWGYLPRVVNFQVSGTSFTAPPYPPTRLGSSFLSTSSVGFYTKVNF